MFAFDRRLYMTEPACHNCGTNLPAWVPHVYSGPLSDFQLFRFCKKSCKEEWIAEWEVYFANARLAKIQIHNHTGAQAV